MNSRLQRHAVRLRGLLAAAVVLVAAASPARATAQRDTIRLGAPRDTVVLGAPDTAAATTPARDPRWATPFAVQSSGQAVPNRPSREVVWLDADSVRARRRAARLAAADSAAAQPDSAVAAPADTTEAADSAPPPPRRTRRAAAADTVTTTTPRRTRTASRDTATTTRRSAPADSAARRRTTTATRPRTHRVAEGETLFGIARRYGVTSAQIRALNPDLVPGELETGMVLRLPAGARSPDAAASTDAPREEAPARPRTTERTETPRRPASETRTPARGRRTHTVAAHETLYGIARRYNVTVDAIRAANHLTNDTLRPGQTLTIPAAAAPR